mmetsp:Transcript_48979/g.149104  ORF Transcript_48979/g.149104 Transcript_48979/m.149104 type:complete len:258 (-) Transcript_48979:1086-1859(-)
MARVAVLGQGSILHVFTDEGLTFLDGHGVVIVWVASPGHCVADALPREQGSLAEGLSHLLRPSVTSRRVEEIADDENRHTRPDHGRVGGGRRRPERVASDVPDQRSNARIAELLLVGPPTAQRILHAVKPSLIHAPNGTLLEVRVSERLPLLRHGLAGPHAYVIVVPSRHAFHHAKAVEDHANRLAASRLVCIVRRQLGQRLRALGEAKAGVTGVFHLKVRHEHADRERENCAGFRPCCQLALMRHLHHRHVLLFGI